MFHLKNKKGVNLKKKNNCYFIVLQRKLLQSINFENKLHSIKRIGLELNFIYEWFSYLRIYLRMVQYIVKGSGKLF